MSGDRLTRGGMDRIAGLHPYWTFAAVALFDLLLLGAIITTLLAGADWTEDWIWPGGPEILPF
ncbi:hypothetical protein [Sphingomonas baiyangensis]|uniref:Uncharacterized protein n=1 Tax=Sphingomonas baiyangensis TaxID=2572576 RepID=A0A4U1L713_9SPHN|nr:hypothetical protein [Sphingomonas baiyangensis]TKD52036.1 hypothetical protein FBR43_15805 [Sphingomonas baiyangensis]